MIEEKEIIEDNKLIAEFMEYKFDGIEFIIPEHTIIIPFDCQPKKSTSLHCFTTTIYKPKDLKFHSSWDWLIPVIKKIREIINVKLNIDSFEEIKEQKLTLNPYDYDIEQVYKAVVEFIKWYNQNKNDLCIF